MELGEILGLEVILGLWVNIGIGGNIEIGGDIIWDESKGYSVLTLEVDGL